MNTTTSPRIAHLAQLRDGARALGSEDLARCWERLLAAEQMAPELAPNGEGLLGALPVYAGPEDYNAPFQDDLADGPLPEEVIRFLDSEDLEAEEDEEEPREWDYPVPSDEEILGIR